MCIVFGAAFVAPGEPTGPPGAPPSDPGTVAFLSIGGKFNLLIKNKAGVTTYTRQPRIMKSYRQHPRWFDLSLLSKAFFGFYY